MATAASSSNGKKYGGIPGIPSGTGFPNRKALRASGVHAEVRAGIFAEKYRDGAYAVLLEYVGQGGLDKPGGTQVVSQKWDWRNKSLQQSYETRKPVRVVRGSKLNSPFRYDGLYCVTKVFGRRNSQNLLECVARMQRLPDQPPLPPPRSPTETSAHAHAIAGASGQPGVNFSAQASSSSHARAELGELTGSSMDTRKVQQAARDSKDEVGSSSKADSEEDNATPDDASDSSWMSVDEDEDECQQRRHGALTSALKPAHSRLRPMPQADDEEEADEELEVQEILEMPVDEGQGSESSAKGDEAEIPEVNDTESPDEKDEAESSDEDADKEGSAVDISSQAASVKRLRAAMLEAAAASELASKSTQTRMVSRSASEAEEESALATGEATHDTELSSSTPEPDDLTIAMAELKESTSLFDAAMQRLRDAERAASDTYASSLTSSTRSTTESDFEDMLGDAAAAAATAADLTSLAIRRRS